MSEDLSLERSEYHKLDYKHIHPAKEKIRDLRNGIDHDKATVTTTDISSFPLKSVHYYLKNKTIIRYTDWGNDFRTDVAYKCQGRVVPKPALEDIEAIAFCWGEPNPENIYRFVFAETIVDEDKIRAIEASIRPYVDRCKELKFLLDAEDAVQKEQQDEERKLRAEKVKFLKANPYLVELNFGKYKDVLVTDVAKTDPNYLRWMLNSMDKVSKFMRKTIEQALLDNVSP